MMEQRKAVEAIMNCKGWNKRQKMLRGALRELLFGKTKEGKCLEKKEMGRECC